MRAKAKATTKPARPRTLRAKKNRPIQVDWSDEGPIKLPRPKALVSLATRVLRSEGQSGRVNLVFCDNSLIRHLNRQFRKLDKITDVLSFHYGEDDDPGGVWGEIYIATPQALKQAPKWKNTFFNELRRLVVHGALHLAGYDHLKSSERLIMRAREDHYLTHGK